MSIFGLLFGPKLLISARNLMSRYYQMMQHWPQLPRVANWPPKFDGILFPSLGTYTRPSSSAFISNFGQIEKFVSISALTPIVKLLGLISTFAPIGMLDLGSTLTLTPSVNRA